MRRIPIFLILCFLFCGCARNYQSTIIAQQSPAHLAAIEQPSESFNTQTEPAGFASHSSDRFFEKEINNETPASFYSIGEKLKKDDQDSTKTEPVLQPMVIAGTAAAVSGAALTVVGAIAGTSLLWIGAGLLIISALLTLFGWKQIKKDPKKYKGEKFAIANYIIIGVIGVAATFYFLYVLFSF